MDCPEKLTEVKNENEKLTDELTRADADLEAQLEVNDHLVDKLIDANINILAQNQELSRLRKLSVPSPN